MSSITSKAFWQAASERAVKTVAQTVIATLGAGAIDVVHVDWATVGSVSIGAGILSVLTSIASSGVGSDPGPSIANETTKPAPPAAVNDQR